MRLCGQYVLLSYKEWCTLRPLKIRAFAKSVLLRDGRMIGVLLQDGLGSGCGFTGWQDGRCAFTGDLTKRHARSTPGGRRGKVCLYRKAGQERWVDFS